MIHALGLHAPIPGRHPRQLYRSSGTPRGSADLAAYLPPVLDQNRVGSCVANALAVAAYGTLSAAGTPLAWVPSVRQLYTVSLCLDRANDYPKTEAADLPPIVDAGTQLLTGAQALAEWGVTAMGPCVTVDGYVRASDCGPSDVTEPHLGALTRTKLLVGAHTITTLRDAKLALDSGVCVATGGWVSSEFDRYVATSAPVGRQDETDPDGGGHATVIYGYEDLPTGGTLWKCRNSWGSSWGKLGNFQASDAFIAQRWEVYAVQVSEDKQ